MKRTTLLAIGTTSCLMAVRAIREADARGYGHLLRAVLVFCEDPAFFGIQDLGDRVRWHRLPNLRAVLLAVTNNRKRYPWILDEDIERIKLLQGFPDASGMAGSPGAGRVAFCLSARGVFNDLRAFHREAVEAGDDHVVEHICSAAGGTGRASLLEASLLAAAACIDDNGRSASRRLVLVLPTFSDDAAPHEHTRRADLALDAWRLVHEGMTLRDRTFTGPKGLASIRARLADSVLIVVPDYNANVPNAKIKGLFRVDDIVTATARMVAGMAGGRGWELAMNRLVDSGYMSFEDVEGMERVRWVCAGNEARIYWDRERLMAGVRAGLVGLVG